MSRDKTWYFKQLKIEFWSGLIVQFVHHPSPGWYAFGKNCSNIFDFFAGSGEHNNLRLGYVINIWTCLF